MVRPRMAGHQACIRQNVCTSLRIMQTIVDEVQEPACIRQNVCTSLRTIQYFAHKSQHWALHTSKRMHFIEDCPSVRFLGMLFPLAYVKTYALH